MRNRDRHLRGLRGPLARRSDLLGATLPLRRRESNLVFFHKCVDQALAKIKRHCPEALMLLTVGVESVPTISADWHEDRIPLAAAVEGTLTRPGYVVVYRRPLERRAENREELAHLVHRTLVEQLAAATGFSVSQLDPTIDND